MNGPRATWGRMPRNVAPASTAAEPVRAVNHQIRANWTALDASSDRAWPPQSVKNGAIGVAGCVDGGGAFIGVFLGRAGRAGRRSASSNGM